MKSLNKKEPFILLLGDLLSFVIALWLSLVLRNLELPSRALFYTHLAPFTLLFIAWIIVFYISGLYEKHTVILKSKLPGNLFNTQLVNSAIAVVFFYLIPFFGITPKTILFIYLLVSFVIILFWRMYGYFALGSGKMSNAILIGSGSEMKELLEEVNQNPIYNLRFVTSVDLNKVDDSTLWDEIVSRIYSDDISIIAIDLSNDKVAPVLPHLYNMIFSNVSFIDTHKIYEDIFRRVPLSLLRYNWFLENVSTSPRAAYDALKRLMDIILSAPLLIVPVITYLLVLIPMKLEDGGPIFITQNRIGKNNKIVKTYKFRTMTDNDNGEYGEGKTSKLAVTRIGNFLRKTRLDEFPQLWNVIRGDVSLIGPRPELPSLVKQYAEDIPYYNVRHVIKPGLSGWAQIYGEHGHGEIAVDETKNKLSYDLYYIKNRSFPLDIKIALQTLRTFVSIAGR